MAPDGMYEPIVKRVLEKAASTGIDSLDPKEMTLLLASELHAHSTTETVALNEIKETLKLPFWKLWTYRELATALGMIAALVGLINWEQLAQFVTTIASAAGAK